MKKFFFGLIEMLPKKIKWGLLPAVLLASLFALTGCGITGVKPSGFAEYKRWFAKDHKSISADGIVFRVKKFKAKPQAKSSFWKEAIVNQLSQSGYIFVDSATLTDPDYPGAWMEFAVPMGQEDYSYLVAVFTRKKKIYLVEAAGEVSKFKNCREAVLVALKEAEL